MDVDTLGRLVEALAPGAPSVAAIAGVVLYVVRVIRAELREQRAARASTSTVGARVGDLEHDFDALLHTLAAQGFYVPGYSTPAAPAAPAPRPPLDDLDEDLADTYAMTEQHRTPVPALPPLPGRRAHAAR